MRSAHVAPVVVAEFCALAGSAAAAGQSIPLVIEHVHVLPMTPAGAALDDATVSSTRAHQRD